MNTDKLKQVIIKECGGLIGALSQSARNIRNRFAKDIETSETTLLQYFLSNALLLDIGRCFGNTHSASIGNDYKMFLQKIILEPNVFPKNLDNQNDNESFLFLKKAGILIELADTTVEFSSQLAKRYYFKWIFSNRAHKSPSNLSYLISKVISNMSATILKNSTLKGDFPKEAVFQYLFMEGLALFTSPDCCICPELSKIFEYPNTEQTIPENLNKTIPGEIDFYLNGSLRWGIELLIKGNKYGEHVSRFKGTNGKYAGLQVKDYTIVDFRTSSNGKPTNVTKDSKRITVFFEKDGDYSSAQCIFGSDEPCVISLSS